MSIVNDHQNPTNFLPTHHPKHAPAHALDPDCPCQVPTHASDKGTIGRFIPIRYFEQQHRPSRSGVYQTGGFFHQLPISNAISFGTPKAINIGANDFCRMMKATTKPSVACWCCSTHIKIDLRFSFSIVTLFSACAERMYCKLRMTNLSRWDNFGFSKNCVSSSYNSFSPFSKSLIYLRSNKMG